MDWELRVEQKELYRYLGYGNKEPDAEIRALAEDCLKELAGAVRPRFFSREFPLRLLPDQTVDVSCFAVRSQNLWRNLQGCEKVILFAATLGTGVDLLLRRYSRLSMSRALVLQAAGTAAIEAFCDEENERLKDEYEEQGYYLRPRFSPGYGDVPLSIQRDLLGILEAEKRVGITLTDSLIMIPSKSVTAVIGAGKEPAGCILKGCESCEKKDCRFRRG